MASTDDLGMLRESPNEETTEDALRRQLLDKDREMDKLLARNVALEDELSKRPPFEDFKRLQAEKKEVDWLFASSNRLNEKCMAKEQRDARWIGILERKLQEIVGDDWQSTLNIGDTTLANASNMSFMPQAESTLLARSSTPDNNSLHSPSPSHSPMLTSSSTITPSTRALHVAHQPILPRNSSPSPSINSISACSPVTGPMHPLARARHAHTNSSTTSLSGATGVINSTTIATTTLAHIAELRALVLGMEEKISEKETKFTEELANATKASETIAALRKEVIEAVSLAT